MREPISFSGADGSVRMFDLRHLEHSTIIYEDSTHTPLLRLSWNKQDPNYLSTMALDSTEVSPKLKFGLFCEKGSNQNLCYS